MDEDSYELIEEIQREDEESRSINFAPHAILRNTTHHEWKNVSYNRRQRHPNISSQNFDDVFLHHIEAQTAELESIAKSNIERGDGSNSSVVAPTKVKKLKMRMTMSDVALKIDPSNLAAFLDDITVKYEKQENIMLTQLVEYFGKAFGSITGSQFQWMKVLKESSVANMIDIPISHISEDVYKTSTEWLKKRSSEALGTFLLWLWDIILADLEFHQGTTKAPQKALQHGPYKSQVAIFIVLAMTLHGKPEILASLVTTLKGTSKYQGQEKLLITVWVIAQACQGDIAVGLFMWVNLLLPMLNSKPSCNPQSRDLILQVVERILASSKAARMLLNGVVRKGERLVPPTALELLMRFTFPASSARVKATERFEVVYPTLKEVALAGPPGRKVMKQITQLAVKAAGEGVSELSNEATNLVIWCLTHHPDSYKQWDELYLDNLEASVRILKTLANEWKDYSTKVASVEPLKATLISFKKKNEKAINKEEDGACLVVLKDAEKLRKMIMARLPKSHTCVKSTVFVSAALAVGATAAVAMSQNTDSWALKKLVAGFI